MRFRKIPKAFAEAIGQLGWRDGCLHVLSLALGRVSGGCVRLHKYYFVAQPVAAKAWLPGRRGAAIEVRAVGPTDPVIREFPRPPAVMPYRFEQGAICFAALKEGRCVGFLWTLLGPYREDEVRCRYVPLPEGEAAWDFDVYVAPEHRSGLVFMRLWDEANRYLAARGVRWSLSRISAFNAASLASHSRMGASRIGSAVFFSIGALQISVSNVRPRFFVSRGGAAAIPSFFLEARTLG